MKSTSIIQVSAYYPPHLGGQENAVHSLANQLAAAGYSVQVLASSQGAKHGRQNETGVQVLRMRGLVFGHAPIMPWFPFALFGAIKKGSVVHLHIGQAFTPEMVWLVAKLRGLKYIAHLHIDFEPSGPAGIFLPLYKKLVLGPVLRSAAAVVTLNQKTLDLIRNMYGYKGRATILNNGIDDSFFTVQRAPFAKQPPRTLRLLFVGRLNKQKNIIALLQALAQTKRRVHLDIIGEGPEQLEVESTIRSLRLKNVTLHGRLGREDVMRFYQTCDTLIMPSLYEAQPLVLLEAMAAGIPIIGTRVLGVEDHIQSIGILVEPTTAGLARGIEQYNTLFDQLPEMTRRGREKADTLRWPQTLKQYEALYEEVLAT